MKPFSHSRDPVEEGGESDGSLDGRIGHFAGRLDILSVSDLVQLLNATRQSGILTIVDEDRHSALLSIHRGEILQAQYRDHRGPEAVYALLRRREGQFEFIQGAPAIPARPMQIPTLALLLDGCRMVDEDAGPGGDGHERGGLLPGGGLRPAGPARVELTPPARTPSLPRPYPV